MHLYLDEYGRYATPTTAQLLTEGRKFGVGTMIAHQTRAQIPDEENRAAELQVGTLICFQLIGADAQELSGEFHVAPEPQWEERVEEIEGTEPILAITQRPVDHLLQHTHQNPDVRAVTHQLLLPLQQRRDNSLGYRYVAGDGLELINSLVVNVMEGRTKPSTEGLADRVQEIVMELRELWISNEEVPFSLQDKVNDCIRAYVNECLWSPVPDAPGSSSPDPAMPADAAGLAAIFLKIWEANKMEKIGPPENWGEFIT